MGEKMMNNKIIAVDFDGTLCVNDWPDIGAPNLEIINYVKGERKKGNKIILWTCRSGDLLIKAIRWCSKQGLIFDHINENTPEMVDAFGSDTRKIFADEYIDDRMINKFKLPFLVQNSHYGKMGEDNEK